MSTTVTGHRTGTRNLGLRLLVFALRLGAAGLVAAMAAIHLHLWADGYNSIGTIGELFLINGIVGGLLAVGLLVTAVRYLWTVAAFSALFTAGTLGALVLSLTAGLFGFQEFIDAPWVSTAIAVESAGIAVLVVLPLLAHRLAHRRSATPGAGVPAAGAPAARTPRAALRAIGGGVRPNAHRGLR